MSDVVISVENLSKQYRLGKVGKATLHDDVNRLLYKLAGKEDPYLKIGEENDRSKKSSSDYVWALKDINFEVHQGDVLGIIGRNGAGKSTLLKILSKVTSPTTGQIKIKGRVASLLEVGTGFHPELSGRDNIFLNGAILGMTRREIKSKFDEIIEFAGIERYIDTPVKRYSSGMYVRLAFAVAAHLEPDILIVDEVLAVGDAEFQKKCLGKMKDVSEREGRTVLFVSHNMLATKNLCESGIFLKNGLVDFKGNINDTINEYMLDGRILSAKSTEETLFPDIENEFIKFISANSYSDSEIFKVNSTISISFTFEVTQALVLNLSLVLKDSFDTVIFNAISEIKKVETGLHTSVLEIPANLLNDGRCFVDIYFVDSEKIKPLFSIKEILSFDVEDDRDLKWVGKWMGAIRPKLNFTIQ